jgi:hypothetical protein
MGPMLYRAMGASDATLHLATRYGRVIFSGIGCVWLMNLLANVARGSRGKNRSWLRASEPPG